MHFDQWAKQVVARSGSRRGLLRLGLGGVLAALVFGQAAKEVAACRGNGKPCDTSKRNGGCCSGTCRKGKCRRTTGAAGCTVTTASKDACEATVRCPKNPDGFCVALETSKPFCADYIKCQACSANAGCTDYPNGKCQQTCHDCQAEIGGYVCLYPTGP